MNVWLNELVNNAHGLLLIVPDLTGFAVQIGDETKKTGVPPTSRLQTPMPGTNPGGTGIISSILNGVIGCTSS